MKREVIAQVAHEVNRAYSASLGDMSHLPWAKAGDAQRASILAGVDMHLANPSSTPQDQHGAWLTAKTADGWTYGEVKDDEKKTHPCLLPYDQLPQDQRSKDWIFKMVVAQLAAIPDAAPTLAAAAPSERLPVQYIGHKGGRPSHKDTIYGTELVWAYQQTLLVPAKIARAMVTNHPEVYAEGALEQAAPAAAAEKVSPTKKELEDQEFQRRQEQLDNIATMTSKQLVRDYVKLHYQQDMAPDMKLVDLKSAASNLVHQFGVS